MFFSGHWFLDMYDLTTFLSMQETVGAPL